ncbi:MAG: hypothetical protein ACJ0F2_02365 [Gammaproteobacteria bacterium]|jgi:hypothetical protein|tara:strand:+ start:653 stop:886 length:234 start_codon:yes stop_codon:yes gene_type:complete
MNSNSLLFAIGAITFLVTFSWFKYAAMEVFKNELKNNEINVGVWSKLFKVFFVDFLICITGVLGTGILFVTIFNFAH